LQDKIAEHAGELIRLQLAGMKELIDMLMKLDDTAKDDAEKDKSNEAAFQQFLRRSDEGAEDIPQ